MTEAEAYRLHALRDDYRMSKEFYEQKREEAREAQRRAEAASVQRENARWALIRETPDGAGQALAESLPWEDLWFHNGKWEFPAGGGIYEGYREQVELARILGRPVETEHNSTRAVCNPGDPYEKIVERYKAAGGRAFNTEDR